MKICLIADLSTVGGLAAGTFQLIDRVPRNAQMRDSEKALSAHKEATISQPIAKIATTLKLSSYLCCHR
jgi:hypothetical protein